MVRKYGRDAVIWGMWFAVAFLTFGPTWSGRNGSGTYTIPNTFTAGQTITAASHNQNFSDIATELTNSVAADGQTSMTGPLKAANGSVSAPAYTFASDTDTGFYRIGANNVGLALGGSKVLDASSSGLDVTGTITQNGGALVPAGTVLHYAGSSVPTGWLAADGTAVSRTTYATLFSNISTTFGTGDGSSTFNLPDCTGRVLAGKESVATRLTAAGSGIDGATLGASGGAQNVTIAQANLPNVNFNVTDPGHVHAPGGAPTGSFYVTQGGSGTNISGAAGGSFVANTASATTGISVASGGSGTAVNKMPPAIVVQCIIKY